MSAKTKLITLTLLLGIPAFMLGRVIWPDAPSAVAPTGAQLPFFVLLSALEALLFGLGVSLLIFGWSWIKAVPERYRRRASWAFLALIWLMVSWWPHDNMHRSNGEDLQGLLYIEYEFHVTLIAASLILAYCFISLVREFAQKSNTNQPS